MKHVVRRVGVFALLLGMSGCAESPVSLPEPTTLAVASGDVTLLVGEITLFAVQVLDQQGRVVRGSQPVFASDNPLVAAVDAEGIVRGVSPGQARVTAAYGGLRESVTVTVTPDRRAQVRSLRLAIDSLVVDTRAGAQPIAFQAVNGFGQPVCPAVSLHSANPAVATARAAGACRIEVVPAFTGETSIVLDAGEVSDTVRVRVTSTGAVAFISARPTGAQLVAGATVPYTVRVIDQTGAPIAGTQVLFSATVGALSASSAVTDAGGHATVEWQIPTDLRQLGQNHSISFRAQLPNGVLAGQNETVFINGASLAEIVLYAGIGWYNPAALQPVQGPMLVPSHTNLTVGAAGRDQYGNVRATTFAFSVTWTGAGWLSQGSGTSITPAGIQYTAIWGYDGTAVFTATAPEGGSRSLQVTFQ